MLKDIVLLPYRLYNLVLGQNYNQYLLFLETLLISVSYNI
mgnify:FL=1